ncbi:PREDICTED: Ribonuclease H [Prunus dulcis]|uniref:PREDICTED: Ribonuclease H n=1 Tax=Prunus dulcis TaxID=3755 RepID=A0A5E4GNG0_PRUDU|nr:PREDICTED: Ribonuclease H [Prunus dulcis]
MSNKVRDLCTICSIGVHCRPRPNTKIVEVMWHLPCFGSVKINTDGTHKSESSKAGSGGVFHDYEGHVLGAFSANLDVPSAVHAEVLAVIKAIELAWLHAWHNVWIETDSFKPYSTDPYVVVKSVSAIDRLARTNLRHMVQRDQSAHPADSDR